MAKSNYCLTSMTGAGSFENNELDFGIRVFIKSVNHKSLDIKINLLEEHIHLEPKVLGLIKAQIARGRVDIYYKIFSTNPSFKGFLLDEAKVRTLLKQYKSLGKEHALLAKNVSLSDLSHVPEIWTQQKAEAKGFNAIFFKVLQKALEDLLSSRKKEGNLLSTAIKNTLKITGNQLKEIEKKVKAQIKNRFSALKIRMEDLFSNYQIDDTRLYQELALLTERSDFTEEVDRLKAHLQHFEDLCGTLAPKGRKLDFICQEMIRESNTLLSKAFCQEVAKIAIQMKSEIEKLREQVQNIE